MHWDNAMPSSGTTHTAHNHDHIGRSTPDKLFKMHQVAFCNQLDRRFLIQNTKKKKERKFDAKNSRFFFFRVLSKLNK